MDLIFFRRGIVTRLCLTLLVAALAGCGTIAGDRLNAADRALIIKATQAALEQSRTGEAKNWENPENGHRGTVVPTRTYGAAPTPCREFQQTLTIEGVTFIAHDAACRDVGGSWKSENYTTLAGAIADAPPYDYDRYYGPHHYPYPHYPSGYWYGRHRHYYGGYGHYW